MRERAEVVAAQQRELLERRGTRPPRTGLAHDEAAVLERDRRLERRLPAREVVSAQEAALAGDETVDLLGDEALVEEAVRALDLLLARPAAAVLDDAPVRRGERRVAEERADLGRRQVEVARRGPRLEQLPRALDREDDPAYEREAVLRVADRELEDVLEAPRAVLAQEEEPGAEGAWHAGGEDAGARHELVSQLVEALDGRTGRCDALAAEHAHLVAVGGVEDRRHLAAGTVQVRLDDLEHEAGRDRGVERVPASLEHRHPALRREPVRGRDHPEGAAELGPGREHRLESTVWLASDVGFRTVRGCTRCGQENPEDARFCNACGNPLTERAATSEERRVVSVVFVDLVGFTSQAERLDPEDVRAILTPYYERVRAELERFGGRVEKFIGDAVMGVFGAPHAFGDDHERAVRAALAVRDWAGEDGLQVRIAVNTGEAIVELDARPGQGEAMIAGDVVNTAARLQSAAPVGAVLVGEETYASTRTWIAYEPGFQRIAAKGKAEPVQAWIAVRAVAPAGERPLTPIPIVGRERELEALKGIWERVAAERRPHLVTVFGPAGIGKSRLALELMEHAGSGEGRVLRGRAMPYGASSPYSAFAQHVKQVARVYDSDELPEARSKLSSAIGELVWADEAEVHAANLALLVGLGENGEAPDRETLFFSARTFVESLGSEGPTLLLFEDIHWADASLLDLIETLASRVRDVPVLFLALARPELLNDRPGWGGGRPAYTALPLDRLTDEASLELAELLLDRLDASEAPAANIAETAEGNPLFIEELAASVAERSTTEATELPTSIRAIVSARLDALPALERSLLADASVVGRVFWRGALERIAPREELSGLLGRLEERDLVRREVVSRIRGDQQYAFKHALIRDVAYQRLPRAERRQRHAVVAEYLEETTAAVGQANEAIADHWRLAGEDDRAVDCLLVAAAQAGRGWAKQHAVALYRAALELIPADDEARRRDVTGKLAIQMSALWHVADARNLRRTTPEASS